MIDTHCHILPAVDDGSPDINTSRAMAAMAYADGVKTIIATPHLRSLAPPVRQMMDERRAALAGSLATGTPGLGLAGGFEVPISVVMEASADELPFLALAGGSYLLLESADTTAETIARAAFRVRLSGLYPVLAHPERTVDMRRWRRELEELVASGDLFMQVTAASVEGRFGRQIRRLCRDLIGAGAARLVASDSHDTVHRPPLLSASKGQIESDFGAGAAGIIMHENPRRVLSGGLLQAASAPAKRRRVLSRLRPAGLS